MEGAKRQAILIFRGQESKKKLAKEIEKNSAIGEKQRSKVIVVNGKKWFKIEKMVNCVKC